MLEVWKEIKGYEGLYSVSSLGNVKSIIRGIILKSAAGKGGYEHVVLSKNAKPKCFDIHKLVAISFLDHVPCGHLVVVDHINNNSSDNRSCNLQLITQRENTSKDKKHVGTSWSKTAKKWHARIRVCGKNKNLGFFTDRAEASEAYQNALALLN